MNESGLDHIVGASLGYVFFGYLMVLPLWALGVGWNRIARDRAVNPWTPPLSWMVFVLLCFVITYLTGETGPHDLVVAVGLLPCTAGCFFAWRKYPKPSSQPVSVAD